MPEGAGERPDPQEATAVSDRWKTVRYQENGAPDRVHLGASIKLSRNYNSFGFDVSHTTDVRPDETVDEAFARIETPMEPRIKVFGAKIKAFFNSMVS